MVLFRSFYILILLFSLITNIVSAEEDEVVTVNGTIVMRLKLSEKVDYQKKCLDATNIIEDKVNEGAKISDIKIKQCPGGIGIYWGDAVIIVVDDYQAKFNKTTPNLLAARWKANIITAISKNPLRLSKGNITMPVGEEQRVTVKGSGKFELKISFDSSMLDVFVDAGNEEVVIKAKAAGTSKIVLKKGVFSGVIKVVSKDWAGKIIPSVEKWVTGSPVPPDIQLFAALSAVDEAITLLPGSTYTIKENPKIVSSMEKGSERYVSVPIFIEGKGYFPVDGNVRIKLINKDISIDDPAVLMISNRPEELEESGVLLRERFGKDKPIRLLYSHKNTSSVKRRLWITLKNVSRKPVKILVIKAYGGPDKYEVQAGHKAAVRYMEYQRIKAGYFMEIPSKGTVLLDEYDIPPNFTLSGLCNLQVVEGEEVELEVKNFDPGKENAGMLKIIEEPFDPFKIHPHGVFPLPTIRIEKTLVIPGQDAVVEIGKWPWLIDSSTGEPNTGNYGVLYNIKMQIINKLPHSVRVGLFFKPKNGTSLGSMLINGDLVETGIIRIGEEYKLKDFELKQGEMKNVEITTLPEASSCYPVDYIFRIEN